MNTTYENFDTSYSAANALPEERASFIRKTYLHLAGAVLVFFLLEAFLFMLHGTQKLLGFPPSGKPAGPPLGGLMTVAGVIEIVAGAMILIGLFASVAAFIASGMMAVAYFMVHQPMGTFPIQNNGEAAALFCFIFLYIAAAGSGIWSVDSIMRGGGTRTIDQTAGTVN